MSVSKRFSFPAKGRIMIFAILQIAAIATIAVVAVYLHRWKAAMRRRNTQSWDSLLARLQPDESVRGWGDESFLKEDRNATPEENWNRIQGAHGLWAMYQNACVMLEMADFAARNSDSVDRDLLATLRSDALHVRVYVLIALAKYAFSQVNEGICVNAFRAASMYTGMADRMAELLQANAAGMVPDFVAAM
jgi:hypothetical protein